MLDEGDPSNRGHGCHGLGPAARAMVAMSDVGGMYYSYVALPKRDVLRAAAFGPRGGQIPEGQVQVVPGSTQISTSLCGNSTKYSGERLILNLEKVL